ncbi:uncharacterized protein LOC133728266 [Rosa rugosa]|uniref:uncharacterized protein LOC133728266 n=1 Tax=Rosa rugosa TaxID=74645 RepID=UPI002B40B103|nr:uncharacterized protein LOC133728266 [Rosa rugosa]
MIPGKLIFANFGWPMPYFCSMILCTPTTEISRGPLEDLIGSTNGQAIESESVSRNGISRCRTQSGVMVRQPEKQRPLDGGMDTTTATDVGSPSASDILSELFFLIDNHLLWGSHFWVSVKRTYKPISFKRFSSEWLRFHRSLFLPFPHLHPLLPRCHRPQQPKPPPGFGFSPPPASSLSPAARIPPSKLPSVLFIFVIGNLKLVGYRWRTTCGGWKTKIYARDCCAFAWILNKRKHQLRVLVQLLRFYLSTRTSDGLSVSTLTLSKGLQNREGEDMVASDLVLKAMQSGVAYYVMGMVVKEKGPVFHLAFHPLATVGSINPGFLCFSRTIVHCECYRSSFNHHWSVSRDLGKSKGSVSSITVLHDR